MITEKIGQVYADDDERRCAVRWWTSLVVRENEGDGEGEGE